MWTSKKILFYTLVLTFLVSIFVSIIVYQILIKSDLTRINTNYNDNSNLSTSTSKYNSEAVEVSKAWLKNLQTSVKYIAGKISPSVVSIIITKDVQTYKTDPFWFFQEPSWVVKQKVWGWTGFFVNKKWLIITNKHVVWDTNASYTVITNNNEEYVGKVLAIDPTTDLAILQAMTKDGKELSNTPAVKFIDSSQKAEVWDFVLAVGNALAEFQNTVTFWVVSGLGRSIQAWDQSTQSTEQLTWLIQTDTAINPGNSWWPLVNLNEEVVWINTAIAAWANWLWFSIPLSQQEVNYLIGSVEKFWKIKRSFIWIRYISLNENIAKSLKLWVTYWDYIYSANPQDDAVVKNSPADKAWLKSWDIIIEVNGTKLKSWLSTKDIIKSKLPWDTISLKVMSQWKEKMMELTLGEN